MEEAATERLIVVAEDNPEHTRLIKEAFNQSTVQHQIIAIATATELMDFLHHRGEYANIRRPDLILLNLNLPGKDGKEILAEIKADSQLRRIPIVVLTTSTAQEDIFKSYSLQGNCYVVKASELEQLFQIVTRIEEFWLRIATLPQE